jgi:hypothetical protein
VLWGKCLNHDNEPDQNLRIAVSFYPTLKYAKALLDSSNTSKVIDLSADCNAKSETRLEFGDYQVFYFHPRARLI